MPAERIVSVQLCDVAQDPMEPLRAESLGYRLPPGQGWGDPVGLLRALRTRGVRPAVLAVEVISDELVAGGVEHAARTVAEATRTVLAAVDLPDPATGTTRDPNPAMATAEPAPDS